MASFLKVPYASPPRVAMGDGFDEDSLSIREDGAVADHDLIFSFEADFVFPKIIVVARCCTSWRGHVYL